MVKPMNEWCGSTAHRPGAKGSLTAVVGAVVMPGTLLDARAAERRPVPTRTRDGVGQGRPIHASYSLTRVTCNTLLLAYYSASTATKPWTRSMMRSTASSADLGRSPVCTTRLRYQLAARMQDSARRYGRHTIAGARTLRSACATVN